MYNKKKRINTLLIIVFALIFLISATGLILQERELRRQESLLSAEALMQLAQPSKQEAGKHKEYSPRLLCQRLSVQNHDFAAWLSIEGTTVDYPVMHTPLQEEFYLERNFNKEYSVLGTPFIAAGCDKELTSDNTIIYGHYAKNDRMFGALARYKERQYLEQHPIIRLEDEDLTRKYEIMAVLVTSADEEAFPYYKFIQAENEEAFNTYIKKIKSLSLYDTGITASYGQKLLTLSTCDYSVDNGRLVIVARSSKDSSRVAEGKEQ